MPSEQRTTELLFLAALGHVLRSPRSEDGSLVDPDRVMREARTIMRSKGVAAEAFAEMSLNDRLQWIIDHNDLDPADIPALIGDLTDAGRDERVRLLRTFGEEFSQ